MSKKQETISINRLFQQLWREKLAFAFIMSFFMLVAFSYNAFVKPRMLKNFELFEMLDSNVGYYLFNENQNIGFAFNQIFPSEKPERKSSSLFYERMIHGLNKNNFHLFINQNYSKYPDLKKPESFRITVYPGSHLQLTLQYDKNVPGEKILSDYINYKIQETIDLEKAYMLFQKRRSIKSLQALTLTSEVKVTKTYSNNVEVTRMVQQDMIDSLQKEIHEFENISLKINIDNLKFMNKHIDEMDNFPKTLPLVISLFLGILSFIVFINLKTLFPIRGK